MREFATPYGLARAEVDMPILRPRSLFVLGHGAGGGITAVDLIAARDAALAAGVAVALVLQPYRVAGRRSPAPAAQLDGAWTAVVRALHSDPPLARTPLIVGGRSSGARVACRTAAQLGAAGVVALAFPVHPPGRPERSRAEELRTGLPTLVVNGDRDPFGVPDVAGVDLRVIEGATHDLRRDPDTVATTVVDWLVQHGWAAQRARHRRSRPVV